MSNFSSLKTAIQQYIKTNGNEEITGAVLQDILLSMVSVMGDAAINDLETALQTETMNRTNADGTLQQNINNEATARGNADTALGNRLTAAEGAITTINTKLAEGYVYAGIATTSTNPGSPTGKVFYIATTAGTYTNFLNGSSQALVLTQGINILKFSGTSWSVEQVIAIDDEPTALSPNLVISGGVVNYVNDKFDPLFRENDEDFAITDPESNAIVIFGNVHIKTKNFRSDATPQTIVPYPIPDLSIKDNNEWAIVNFINGHIKTKNFDSELHQNPLLGKKVSILGDSISTYEGYVYSQNAAVAYPKTWMNNVKNTYWMKTINMMGAVLGVNDSWAGTMVSNTQPTDSGVYGPNRCLSSQTRVGHLGENGTPDVIIVQGGTNDIGQQVSIGTFNTENPINYTDAQIAALPVATFADAYRAMMIRLQKTYPLARIVAILPNYINSSLDHYISDDLDEYIEMERTICDYFGVKYLDCRTCGITLFNRATYLGDGIHPNTDGMSLIANQLIKLLLTI